MTENSDESKQVSLLNEKMLEALTELRNLRDNFYSENSGNKFIEDNDDSKRKALQSRAALILQDIPIACAGELL
jgi:hypothetical protein